MHRELLQRRKLSWATCLANTTGTVSATPRAVASGGSVTVRWSVQAPSGCSITQTLNTQPVARSGITTFQPMANASYVLRARSFGVSRILASVSVTVELPVINGWPTVTINANDQVPLFVQALSTSNALVYLENHDGSGYLAYRNLVLENGGWQDWGYFHTHMFDMHGQDDCWDAGTRDHGLQQRWPDRHPVAPHRRPGCDLVLRGRTVPGRRVSAQGRRELGD
jgi:hypothetical protein